MSHSRSTVRVTRTLDTPLGVASAVPAAAGILLLHHLAVDVRQTQLELIDMRLYTRIGWHEATLETELCHGAGPDDRKD